MKTLFKISIFMLIMGFFASTAYADVVITVYGSGGIIVLPDGTKKVCPDPGSGECAVIKLPDLETVQKNLTAGGIEGILIYKGKSSNVMFLEFPNLREQNGGFGCQGAVFQIIN